MPGSRRPPPQLWRGSGTPSGPRVMLLVRAVFILWDSSQHLANRCPFEGTGSPGSMAPTLSWQRGRLSNKTSPILLSFRFKNHRYVLMAQPQSPGSWVLQPRLSWFPGGAQTVSPSARALAFPHALHGCDHAQQHHPGPGLREPHAPDTQGAGFGEHKPVPTSTKPRVCLLSLFRSQMCLLASGPRHRPL